MQKSVERINEKMEIYKLAREFSSLREWKYANHVGMLCGKVFPHRQIGWSEERFNVIGNRHLITVFNERTDSGFESISLAMQAIRNAFISEPLRRP